MEPKTNLGYLIHHLAFSLDRQSDQVLKERLGIGLAQYKILMALKWQSHFQQREIADYLGQSEASVSRQIKLLGKRGLVSSRISPRSRREHHITLTARGDQLLESATDALNSYHLPLVEDLSEKKLNQLSETLMIMHARICPAGDRCAYNR